MEKLENYFKENLEKREIPPSSEAWDRIAGELTVQEQPKRNRRYWYAVASCFIGLLLGFLIWLNTATAREEPIQVVEEDSVGETPRQWEKPNADSSVAVADENKKTTEEKEGQQPPKTPKSDNTQMATTPMEQAIVMEQRQLNDVFLKEKERLIVEKVNQVASQVADLESITGEVTDAEVDSLLRHAQRQILAEELFVSNNSVDPRVLLATVEEELDASFRDQIFDALKEGYSKLRTAVAERNN